MKKIALIYFNVKEPKKETVKLQVIDFAVSYYDNLEDAHFFAYYEHGVHLKTKNANDTAPMFRTFWQGFRICFFQEVETTSIVCSMQNIEKTVRKRIYEMYSISENEREIISLGSELYEKVAEYILPQGYEIATDGIIDGTYKVMWKSDFLFPKSSCFYQHWIRPYIGKNTKDVIKGTNYTFVDIDGVVTNGTSRGTVLIRPILQ